GYTQGARTGILALRPAPIQIAYLGYPGPMGAEYIDYTLVDRYVVPPNQERFYDEKLVVLPGCYQPNDSRRQIAVDAGRRSDHGRPENGFVFCCFNQPYKITAEVFGWWIGLLLETPGSVLWLLAFNEDMQGRLRRELKACGLASHRVVFAGKLPLAEHLARLGHADLFLDTWPSGRDSHRQRRALGGRSRAHLRRAHIRRTRGRQPADRARPRRIDRGRAGGLRRQGVSAGDRSRGVCGGEGQAPPQPQWEFA